MFLYRGKNTSRRCTAFCSIALSSAFYYAERRQVFDGAGPIRRFEVSRSIPPSGAVIATSTGEILAAGCDEVPRAGGGVLWDDVAGTDRDYCDYKLGQDPAGGTRKDIVAEILQALAIDGWLVAERQTKRATLVHKVLFL